MYGYADTIRPMPESNHEIVERATRLSQRALASVGADFVARHGFPFDRVYEDFIYPEYGVRLVEDRVLERGPDGASTLGFYDPLTNTAYVDARFQTDRLDRRREFTRWHEVVGHGVMQRDWLLAEYRRLGLDATSNYRPARPRVEERLEHQANLAGAVFAAPEWLLRHAMRYKLDLTRGRRLEFRGPGTWHIGPPGNCPPRYIHDFDELCRVVAQFIRPMFGQLSVEALSYRLQTCRYLLDATVPAEFVLFRRATPRVQRRRTTRERGASALLKAHISAL